MNTSPRIHNGPISDGRSIPMNPLKHSVTPLVSIYAHKEYDNVCHAVNLKHADGWVVIINLLVKRLSHVAVIKTTA